MLLRELQKYPWELDETNQPKEKELKSEEEIQAIWQKVDAKKQQ